MIYVQRIVGLVVLLVSFLFISTASLALAKTLTFLGASDMSVATTSPSGTAVDFSVTATDASSTSYAVICAPPSGSIFVIGTTTVNCQAADSTGATSTAQFNVGVSELPVASSTPTASSTTPTATSTIPVATSTTPVATSTMGLTLHVNVPATCTATDTNSVAHTYGEASSTSAYLGICALEAALTNGTIASTSLSNQYPSLGLFVTAINGIVADPSSEYWALYLNGSYASTGLTQLPVLASSTLEFQLHDFSDNNLGDRVTIIIDSLLATSSAATPPSATSSDATITFSIRDGGMLIGPATLTLPSSSDPIEIAATGTTTKHTISSRSVLALLSAYDATSSDFSINQLDYYDSYGAFYVNCMSIPAATSSPQCGEWQDEVNGVSPSVGMDQQLLSSGDSVIIYFGSPRTVSLSTSSISVGTPFTATAEAYNPTTDTYAPTTGITLGIISIPDPSTSWVYTEVATSSADSNGQAVFTLNKTGTYEVGIAEDYYSPHVPLTVTATTSAPTQPSGGGGGGGGGGISHQTLAIPSAVSYLEAHQNIDGSFGSDMITDWVAMAFATQSTSSAKTALANYLRAANPTLSSVTDYERHALALEDFGINPYSGTGRDYITPIVTSFDGTQIGDPTLDNDDIFALLALHAAGYPTSNDMMGKIATFIISKQKTDGSWDENPDMTAAALQVLPQFFVGTNVSPVALGQALGMGGGYLINTQQRDGGWGNIDSTSWVQIFINATNLDDSTNARIWSSTSGYLPTDAIAAAQQGDGGVRPTSDSVSSRVWSTAYAVYAASGWDWDNLLGQFAKPMPIAVGGGGGGGNAALLAQSDLASTTFAVATTTLATASSSQRIIKTTLGVGSTTRATPFITTPLTNQIPTQNTGANHAPVPAHTPAQKKSTIGTPVLQTLLTPNITSQTASAANSGGGFLSWFWHGTVSFFTSLFGLL